jgi:hypothetical protein
MDESSDAVVTHLPSLGDAVEAECAPVDAVGAVCTGFVVIAEWVDIEGNQTLTKVFCDPRGKPPAPWRVLGWLDYAIKRFS